MVGWCFYNPKMGQGSRGGAGIQDHMYMVHSHPKCKLSISRQQEGCNFNFRL